MIAIAEENDAATFRESLNELGKKRKRRHGGFVDHEQINWQRILAIVPEVDRVASNSEESMNRGRAYRHARLYFLRAIQFLQTAPKRFFQPRCCLAGRRGERHPEAFVSGLLEQATQNLQDRGGFAGAWSAANNSQLIFESGRDRLILAADFATIDGRIARCFCSKRIGQPLLVVPSTGADTGDPIDR